MITQLEVNWNHVKDVIEEVSKEISDKRELNFVDEGIPEFYANIRVNLTNIMDYNHDGWPIQELVESDLKEGPHGIPAEVARVVIHILNFCRKKDIDLSDAIKTVLEGRVL